MLCPRCGARVSLADNNCQACGETIPEPITLQSVEEKPKNRNKLVLWIVIAVVIVSGIALSLIFLLPKNYERVEINTSESYWTDLNHTLLVYGEVENKTSHSVEPQFVVSLLKAGQKVDGDSYGSLITKPFQNPNLSLTEEISGAKAEYEIREGMLKPGEKGSYLVRVEIPKDQNGQDLAFDNFVIRVEKKTE